MRSAAARRARARRRWLEGSLGDVRLGYIGREALVRNKEAAGRAKDLADLEALKAASGEQGARKPR